jgi:hypothetical protein
MSHWAWLVTALAAAGCSAADGALDVQPAQTSHEGLDTTEEALSPSFPIIPRKSVLITDVDIVSQFTLFDVMNQLVTQAAVPGLTPLRLFQQMFDTEQPAPGVGPGPHCVPDALDTAAFPVIPDLAGTGLLADGTPGPTSGSINGWPAQCPRLEAQEASRNPFTDPSAAYMATTLSNRFDLAPLDGSNCGEFRVNFARQSGQTDSGARNFIAFEARLPNPKPALGLGGCTPIVQFWQSLSNPAMTQAQRGAALKQFYFTGIDGFAPVIDVSHYGAAGGPQSGQVRINQFMFIGAQFGDWSAREFRLLESCTGSTCTLQMIPNFDKDAPAAPVFAPASTDPRAVAFQTSFFPGAVARLALQDVNAINYPSPVPDAFNTGDDQLITDLTDYTVSFGTGPSTLRTAIQQQLTAIGSTTTPDQIVERAQSLSCAGCHLKSLGEDMGFPQAQILPTPNRQSFVQVTEQTETIPAGDPAAGGTRFSAQPAVDLFVKHRAQIMADFLSPIPGFERPGGWSSAQAAVSLVSTPVTQGSSALRIVPTLGWTEIDSATPFSTVNLAPIGPKLAFDLFLPTQQPNPTWHGTVTVLIQIPSARIALQQVGQVALNGLALGTFVPVSMPLPAAVESALALGVNDVSVSIQLNVNPNTNPYFFDNLRFH